MFSRSGITTLAVWTLIAGTASAAEMAAPVYKAPRLASPATDWSGFYVGVHGTAAWNEARASLGWGAGTYLSPSSQNALGVAQTSHQNFDFDQFGGGLQAGFNYQTGATLYGVEADFTWLGGQGSTSVTAQYVAASPIYTIAYATKTDWLATLRGRLGFAADRWLIYATGGLALTGTNFDWSFSDTVPGAGNGNSRKVHTSYVVGGGVEYVFSGNLSAKLEYLYVPLDSNASGIMGEIPSMASSNILLGKADLDIHLVKIGVNYKFGAAGARN